MTQAELREALEHATSDFEHDYVFGAGDWYEPIRKAAAAMLAVSEQMTAMGLPDPLLNIP